jgi:protocatechuate 3,4-dioxygenase, beta subunit
MLITRASLSLGLVFVLLADLSFGAKLLDPTPRLSEGRNYPAEPPTDTDNDLVIVKGNKAPALGQIVLLKGKVLNTDGSPFKNTTVEIWQSDANGFFVNEPKRDDKTVKFDRNFQGYGRCDVDGLGEYSFRTLKPVPSVGRAAPHIFIRVKQGNLELITTQLFVRGHEGNKNDEVFQGIKDVLNRELVLADFKTPKDPKAEITAQFDIVVGGRSLDASRRVPQETPEP